ncbi:MAG: hypothetical protein ACYTG6_07135, partial [Planctomycetota bacterium]
MRAPPVLLLLLLGAGTCGCGEDGAPAAPPLPPDDPPARTVPRPRLEAGAWIGGEGSCADLASLLRSAPDLDAAVAATPDAAQSRMTACIQDALASGELEAAHTAFEGLLRFFEGRGRTDRGLLSEGAIRGAIFEDALAAGRRRAEGPDTDAYGALEALGLAARLATEGADPEMRSQLAGVTNWVTIDALADLPGTLGDHVGPRVVAYADDFNLGEPWLLPVLGRWAAEGAEGGLRVGVVPIYRGTVRQGIRRIPATAGAEHEAIAARLAGGDVVLEGRGVFGSNLAAHFAMGHQ